MDEWDNGGDDDKDSENSTLEGFGGQYWGCSMEKKALLQLPSTTTGIEDDSA